MNLDPVRESRLSPPGHGISCDAGGAFAGPVPLLKRAAENPEAWQPRPCGELSEALSNHYGLPVDVSAKRGGLTDNQKEVYPYILRGGEVIPVGLKAEEAGFDIGVPVAIRELYVGHDLPSNTAH